MLTKLDLFSNNISFISFICKNSFRNLLNLNVLHLFKNDLASLDVSTFSSLTSLNTLTLSSNNFSFINNELFANLTCLQTLRLDNNNLVNLTSFRLSGALKKSLLALDLSSNQLTVLNEGTFSDLILLQELRLNNNLIYYIDSLIFAGMLGLERVYLGNNIISKLQPSYVKKLCASNPKCTIYI
jgi:Leucine-rich repeat (LRR) protein